MVLPRELSGKRAESIAVCTAEINGDVSIAMCACVHSGMCVCRGLAVLRLWLDVHDMRVQDS